MWYLKINIFQIFHQRFGNISLAKLWRMSKKGLMKGLPKHLPHFEDTQSIHLSNKAEKNPWVQPLIYQSFTLVSFFKCIFHYLMSKSSVYLPQLLWLYTPLHHIHLGLHPEEKWRLLILKIIYHYIKESELNLPLLGWINMDHLEDIPNLYELATTWKS